MPPHGYGAFYMNVANYPELGQFRRFGAYWAKKLHDDTSECRRCLEAVNREIASIQELGVDSILHCPLWQVKKKCPEDRDEYKNLYLAWDEYNRSLVNYGATLCMSEQIMNLPDQNPYYTKHMAEFQPPFYKSVFEDNHFVPTGESETTYLSTLGKKDTCAWRDVPQGDFLTIRFIHSSKWIEKHILDRVRRCFKSTKHTDPRSQTDVRHGRIVAVMDTLTCITSSGLLTAAILALAWVRPLGVRIAIVGVFGTVFALAAKLLAGHTTRGEVFAATAAFYAVAVVFVGTTGNDCKCR